MSSSPPSSSTSSPVVVGTAHPPVLSLTVDERSQRVCDCVAQALEIPIERVTLTANLVDDLGADSLAFLDIVFRIEQVYGIEITRGEMERAARGTMSDDEFAPGGLVSPAGLERLRTLMPEGGDRLTAGLRANQILTLFTVETFFKIAEGKLHGDKA